MDEIKKFFEEFQCKQAYQRVADDKKNGKASSDEDLYYASLYENSLFNNNLIETNSKNLSSLFDFNNNGKIDFDDYKYYSESDFIDIDGDGEISNEEQNFFEYAKSVINNNLPKSNSTVTGSNNNHSEGNSGNQVNSSKENNDDLQNNISAMIQMPAWTNNANNNYYYIDGENTQNYAQVIRIDTDNNYDYDYDYDYDYGNGQDVYYERNENFYNNDNKITDKSSELSFDMEMGILRKTFDKEFADLVKSTLLKKGFPDTFSEDDFDDTDTDSVNSSDLYLKEIDKFSDNEMKVSSVEVYKDEELEETSSEEIKAKKIEDYTDEELVIVTNNFLLAAGNEINFSEIARDIRNILLAYFAEGLSRNIEFFKSMEDKIENTLEKLEDKIAELEEKEAANYDDKSRKLIEELFEDYEIDDEYKELASHITCLLGLTNGEKVSRFGTGSNDDVLFNLRRNGKTYLAKYTKLEDEKEKVYIDNGKENFEEVVFDKEGKLREKTIKIGNRTVKEEFFDGGVKFKTITEKLADGSIKINKERKFPNGTIMKFEKIIKPEAANTDKRDNFTFSQDKVKGNCDLVDQDGSITGKITVETLQESKAKTKKNIKTAKNNSKSNINS